MIFPAQLRFGLRTPEARDSRLLERETPMSVKVKDGTPLHGPPLCESCVNAHIEQGYGSNELMIFCQATWPEHRVRFRVRACSGYLETKRQSLKQMEDMAWVLMPREGKRIAGFVRPDEREEDEQIEIELKDSQC